jgi:hypothetical protein
MASLFLQLIGLLLLLGGVWLGWHRWGRPYHRALDMQAKGMLALAIVTIVGGLVGSPFWWMDYPDSFSWKLPPLASRILAAAGLAFAVTGCYALERKQRHLVRPYIWLLAVYLGPLVVAILLFHLDRFDWHAPITYAFFAVAGGMAAAAVWHIARGTELTALDRESEEEPLSSILRPYLWIVAMVMGAWGLAMFVFPQGPQSQIWLWPNDPLTSRLIASMLLTLSAGAILALRTAEAAKMNLWLFVTYGVGVTAACLWNAASGKPVPLAYAVAFTILTLTSLLMLWISFREISPGAEPARNRV